MATRKKAPRSIAQLLGKELHGEPVPAAEDLALTVRAALGLAIIEPWLMLADSNVFAFDSDTGQRWYCIVMGALGQVYGLQAFRGDAGFTLFDDIQHERIDAEGFLAQQDLFTVELVRRVELTAVDRAILALAPDSIPAGLRVPQVTVSRPRRLRWYPNADELAEINDGLFAALLFFEWLAKNPKRDPWENKGELPLVVNADDELRIETIPFPARVEPPVETVKLEERRLNVLLSALAKRKVGPALEVDVFLFRSPVGGDGRPFFPWTSLVCETKGGLLVAAPQMAGAQETHAQTLVNCVLDALEKSATRPAALRVSTEAKRAVLEPLAQIFEIPLEVADLPHVEEAREALERSVL